MINKISFGIVLILALVTIVYCQNGVNYVKTFTAADKAQLLDTHNRARLAVKAKIMPNLTWDQGLADIWPNSNPNFCTFNHFSGRNTAYGSTVGENLYASSYSTINLDSFVTSWVNEKVDYTLGKYPSTCASGKVCGHYTQIIWANTLKVGCALFDCTSQGGWRNLLVCNYSPAGNYMNQYAYEVGTSSTCVPTDPCSGVQCGTKVNNCQQTVSCSNTCSSTQTCSTNTCNACASQCGTKTCGTVYNSCYNNGNGGTETCGPNNGGCPTGQSCVSNQCTTPPPTCTPTITQSYCDGTKCGSYSNGCGGTVSCTCGTDKQCQSGTCVDIPSCGGTCRSDLFETCTNNQCTCVTGYSRDTVTGACVANPPPSTSNPLSKWEPFLPVPPATGSTDWVLLPDGSRVEMVGSGATNYRIRWLTSSQIIKEEKTVFKTDILLTGNGEFGLALREQTSKTVFSLWRLTISGTSVAVNWDTSTTSTRNKSKSPLYSGWKANDWNTVELTMADLPQYDANYQTNYVWFTLKVNGVVVTPSTYNGYPYSAFSNTGAAFLYTKQYASFKNTYLITSTSLLVSFSGCLTSTQLSSLCSTYGASDCRIEKPCSTKRQAEGSTTAVITFTSTDTVSSDALASQFSHAVTSQDPRLSEYSITKVEDGQQFSGETNVDESQVSIENPTETNVEGGATGGGESGLSTGGIIGVAVAGGVVALAAAGLLVAGVAVAGVVIARKVIHSKNQQKLSGNNNNNSNKSSEPKNLKTGADLFDYDDDDPVNKHKSITARVPEGFSDSISHL